MKLSLDIQEKSGAKKITEFQTAIGNDAQVHKLAEEVEAFASQFPIPGFEVGKI